MDKFDEKTVVPIGWVLSGFISVLAITVIGAFWVSTVNFRLERIEDKLGIPPYHTSMVVIDNAHAKGETD